MSLSPARTLVAGLLLGLGLVGCEPTTLEVVNRAGAASLARVRWVRADGEGALSVPGRVPPGGTSDPVDVYESEVDQEGVLRFELLVGGARVELERVGSVKLERGRSTTVEVRADDRVVNRTF